MFAPPGATRLDCIVRDRTAATRLARNDAAFTRVAWQQLVSHGRGPAPPQAAGRQAAPAAPRRGGGGGGIAPAAAPAAPYAHSSLALSTMYSTAVVLVLGSYAVVPYRSIY
jgi:hypothetical protein